MRVNDSFIPLKGKIRVRLLNRRGVCVYRYDSPNTITYTAPLVLLDLLTQGWAGTTAGAVTAANQAYTIDTHPAGAARGFVNAQDVVAQASRNQIAYMKIGIGNGAPTRSDVAVSAWTYNGGAQALATSEVKDIHYTNNGEVQFVALFDTNQANVPEGAENPGIREVGLFTRGYDNVLATAAADPAPPTVGETGVGSRMFARQIHAEIRKSDEFQLEYTWTVLLS